MNCGKRVSLKKYSLHMGLSFFSRDLSEELLHINEQNWTRGHVNLNVFLNCVNYFTKRYVVLKLTSEKRSYKQGKDKNLMIIYKWWNACENSLFNRSHFDLHVSERLKHDIRKSILSWLTGEKKNSSLSSSQCGVGSLFPSFCFACISISLGGNEHKLRKIVRKRMRQRLGSISIKLKRSDLPEKLITLFDQFLAHKLKTDQELQKFRGPLAETPCHVTFHDTLSVTMLGPFFGGKLYLLGTQQTLYYIGQVAVLLNLKTTTRTQKLYSSVESSCRPDKCFPELRKPEMSKKLPILKRFVRGKAS